MYMYVIILLCLEVKKVAGELLDKWMAIFREGQAGMMINGS